MTGQVKDGLPSLILNSAWPEVIEMRGCACVPLVCTVTASVLLLLPATPPKSTGFGLMKSVVLAAEAFAAGSNASAAINVASPRALRGTAQP